MSRNCTTENWHKAEKTEARGHKMRAPYDNVFIGCDPLDGMTPEIAKQYDAIVNVSCTQCAYFYPAFPGQAMHWYPLNEMGYWGYGYLFWIKQVMDFHHDKGHKIYLHCHAGAYRSPTAACLWLMGRGHTLDEAKEIEYNNAKTVKEFKENEGGRMWKFTTTYLFRMGNVPAHDKIVEFYRRMRERKNPESPSLADVLFHDGKNKDSWIENNREVFGEFRNRRDHWLHKTFWFYYEPKWWLKSWWYDATYKALGWQVDKTRGYSCWSFTEDCWQARFRLKHKGIHQWVTRMLGH
jgi:hypothetical protein